MSQLLGDSEEEQASQGGPGQPNCLGPGGQPGIELLEGQGMTGKREQRAGQDVSPHQPSSPIPPYLPDSSPFTVLPDSPPHCVLLETGREQSNQLEESPSGEPRTGEGAKNRERRREEIRA